MTRLQNIVAYLCINYPYKLELSKARLTKLVYLADWFSSLVDEKQMTEVEWLFNHYGPYVDDVVDSVRNTRDFSLAAQENHYGSTKVVVGYQGNPNVVDLSEREKSILDAVIDKTKGMYFNSFIDYVYSTYPVKSSDRYAKFDLVSLAKEYKSTVR